jgi:predicted transcriptional regulator
MENKILSTQLRQLILVELANENLTFSNIKKRFQDDRDQLSVQLSNLIKWGAIYKSPMGIYSITPLGREKINSHMNHLISKIHNMEFVGF